MPVSAAADFLVEMDRNSLCRRITLPSSLAFPVNEAREQQATQRVHVVEFNNDSTGAGNNLSWHILRVPKAGRMHLASVVRLPAMPFRSSHEGAALRKMLTRRRELIPDAKT